MQNVSQLPSLSCTCLLNDVNNVQKDACLRENEESWLVMIVVSPVSVHLLLHCDVHETH
jgi:hypothetical protein